MALVLKLGTLDLSDYVRVTPGEGLDLAPGGHLEPTFIDSPYADGADLASIDAHNAELAIPLFLNAPSKDALHALHQAIRLEAAKRSGGRLAVEWRDTNAGKSTFRDVEFVRFDPDFNFRRQEHSYLGGILRVWGRAYAHSGTQMAAQPSAPGTQSVVKLAPVASYPAGDVPGLGNYVVRSGSHLPLGGRLVGLAVLPHPSYKVAYSASEIIQLSAATVVVGPTGVGATHYVAYLATTPEPWPEAPGGRRLGAVPLAIPTVYAGRNRVFIWARSLFNRTGLISAEDLTGRPLGPTALLPPGPGFRLLDLGALAVPTVAAPAATYGVQFRFGLEAMALHSDFAYDGADPNARHLHVNRVLFVPEDTSTVIVDEPPLPLARDNFIYADAEGASRALADAIEPLSGLTWASAPYMASGTVHVSHSGGGVVVSQPSRNVAAVLGSRSVRHAAIALDFFADEARAATNWGAAYKALGSGGFLLGRLKDGASKWIDIAHGSSNGNLAVIACRAASQLGAKYFRIEMYQRGPAVTLNIRALDGQGTGPHPGEAVACLFASRPAFDNAGEVGLAGHGLNNSGVQVPYFEAYELEATQTLLRRDRYHLEAAPIEQSYREETNGALAVDVTAGQRALTPRVPVPSVGGFAAFQSHIPDGYNHDLISVQADVRERFTYAR